MNHEPLKRSALPLPPSSCHSRPCLDPSSAPPSLQLQLRALPESYPALHSVTLSPSSCLSVGMLGTLPGLSRLTLQLGGRDNQADLPTLAQLTTLTALHLLELPGDERVDSQGFRAASVRLSFQSACYILNLSALAPLAPRLRELVMGPWQQPDCLGQLSGLTGLRRLELRGGLYPGGAGSHDLAALSALRNLTGLVLLQPRSRTEYMGVFYYKRWTTAKEAHVLSGESGLRVGGEGRGNYAAAVASSAAAAGAVPVAAAAALEDAAAAAAAAGGDEDEIIVSMGPFTQHFRSGWGQWFIEERAVELEQRGALCVRSLSPLHHCCGLEVLRLEGCMGLEGLEGLEGCDKVRSLARSGGGR